MANGFLGWLLCPGLEIFYAPKKEFTLYEVSAMTLQNHFDVAHLLGHPAFEHLAGAMSAYDQAKQT